MVDLKVHLVSGRARSMRLDPLDAEILRLLARDARLSFREIAKRVGSTTPTVAARVRALEDLGIIQGYHARIDPAAMGDRPHVLLLSLRPDAAADAVAELGALAGVVRVELLVGGRLLAHVHVRPPLTLAAVHDAVAAIPGLTGYDAFEVLRAGEAAAAHEVPADVDVPCHQCGGPIHGDPVKAKLGERAHVFCCRQCADTFRSRFDALAKGARHERPVEGHDPSPTA